MHSQLGICLCLGKKPYQGAIGLFYKCYCFECMHVSGVLGKDCLVLSCLTLPYLTVSIYYVTSARNKLDQKQNNASFISKTHSYRGWMVNCTTNCVRRILRVVINPTALPLNDKHK